MLAASTKISRTIDDRLQAGSGLSSPEFSVLVSLSEADGRVLRLRELCENLGWDRSRASHQVTRMQRRGLITKCKSPGDARGVLVKLTDDGLTRVTQAAPDHVESVRRIIFDHLEPEDIAALRRFFGGIMEVDNVPGIPKCSEINKFD